MVEWLRILLNVSMIGILALYQILFLMMLDREE